MAEAGGLAGATEGKKKKRKTDKQGKTQVSPATRYYKCKKCIKGLDTAAARLGLIAGPRLR